MAAQPRVWIAPIYLHLESVKDCVLKAENGNFDAKIELPRVAKEDLAWWIDSVDNFPSPVNRNKPVCVKSDASKRGWGVECNGQTTGGMWTSEESVLHINCLELKSAFFALKSFCKTLSNCTILLQTDNSTTVIRFLTESWEIKLQN